MREGAYFLQKVAEAEKKSIPLPYDPTAPRQEKK